MTRVSTETTGFYTMVTAKNMPDDGSLVLEVLNSSGSLVQTFSLAVVSEESTIDISEAVARQWPDNAQFRLRSTTSDGEVLKWITNSNGDQLLTRRAGAVPTLVQVTGPLNPGNHTMQVAYPDDNVNWRVDFFVGGLEPENDQGLSIAKSDGADSYQVTIPNGVDTIDLYIKYWVDGADSPTNLVLGENYQVQTVAVETPAPVTGSGVMTYPEIRVAAAQSKPNIIFDFKSLGHNEYHARHLAEYLRLNPSVRYWSVDESAQQISKLATPTVPGNVITLPAPSGGDDTSAVRSVFQANPGGSFTGLNRTYKINNMSVDSPGTLFDMKVSVNGTTAFAIKSDDVRHHNVHADLGNRTHIEKVWELYNGSDRFHLTDSSATDYHGKNSTTNSRNFSAVWFRGRSVDYHIVGNSFKDLINEYTGSATGTSRATCRANAFLYNGHSGNYGGGYICSNELENFQSNGSRDDAESFTMQNGTGVDGNIYFLANRQYHAGKRELKLQHNAQNVFAFSGSYEWDQRQGPLGDRKQLTIVNFQQASKNSSLAHNSYKLGGEGRWDALITFENTTAANDGAVFENNDIDIVSSIPANYYAIMLKYKIPPGSQPTGNRYRQNRFRSSNGQGQINYMYDWNGYQASRWDLTGNIVNVPYVYRETK